MYKDYEKREPCKLYIHEVIRNGKKNIAMSCEVEQTDSRIFLKHKLLCASSKIVQSKLLKQISCSYCKLHSIMSRKITR